MLDILRDFLASTVTPELFDEIEKAWEFFENIGLDNFEFGFQEILMLHGTDSGHDTVTELVGLVKDLQDGIMLQHGIVFNPEALLHERVAVCQAILDIPVYEKQNHILDIMAGGSSNTIEVFAEIMSLVAHLDEHVIINAIESVDFSLLKKIAKISKKREALDIMPLDVAEERQQMAEVMNFWEWASKPSNKAYEMLKNGIVVGMPVRIYVELLDRHPEDLEPKDAAIELFMIALMSEEGYKSPFMTVKSILSDVVADLEKASKITLALNEIQMGYKGNAKK